MNEVNQPEKANKKNIIIITVAALVLIIALVFIVLLNQKTEKLSNVVNEKQNIQNENNEITKDGLNNFNEVNIEEGVIPEAIKDARKITEQTNYITKDNIVVTDSGEAVKMNIDPVSSDAPQESKNLSAEDVPNDEYTVKLSVSASGFSPNTFTVSPGQLVNLVLTSADTTAHILKFEDENLLGALLGVAKGETKMKVWNAPTTPGEYRFFCSIPGHEKRGEVGIMIVE